MKKQELKALIAKAFAANKYPGDWCLKGSTEGCEPYQVEQEFKGKKDWQALDSKFLDQAPGGLASALSFFSDEAFRFYLAAYLIADIDNRLENVDVLFHLTHGLDNKSRSKKINPLRYERELGGMKSSINFQFFRWNRKKQSSSI
jgi:hypothetical protein